MISWCSQQAQDANLALLQQAVKRYQEDPYLVNYFEPHSEIAHGEHDLLLEYGPVADQTYRRFLQGRRDFSLPQLNQRWGTSYTSWEEVRVPELASFMGWSEQAIDLTGTWQVHYATQEEGEGQKLFAPDLDISDWPEIIAPGHDHLMFVEKKPAWWRREFMVSAEWLAAAAGQPIYLYLWDLNRRGKDRPVVAYLNGQPLGSDICEGGYGIAIFEVTESLQEGPNLLAVYLPDGYIAYRAYVAAHEPLQYPYLGREQNAQWVDFRDWSNGNLEEQLTEKLPPGSRHAIALEVKGTPYVGGIRGNAFLEYEPRPQEESGLGGTWLPSADGLKWSEPVTLPGTFEGRMARQTVTIPQDWQGKTVMIHALTEGWPVILSVITNGHMVRRHHHIFGTRCDLNITPFLKFGAENEIEIVANSAGNVKVAELYLRAYPAEGQYP